MSWLTLATARSYVHLTGPGGLDRVLPTEDYLTWPSAALLGTRATPLTRREAIALLARTRSAAERMCR